MTTQINDRIPVIIGVGQFQMDVPENLEGALGPIDIAAKAIEIALLDTGLKGLEAKVDRLTAIRTFGDSGPTFPCPFGASKNMPRSIGTRANLSPETLIYSPVGGDQPQTQVFEAAKAIFQMQSELAVVCGGEAIANMKAAMRAAVALDWSDEPEDEGLIDEGPFPDGLPLHPEEIRHGMMLPIQYYAMMETARRLELGLSVEDYQKQVGDLFAPFADCASKNPFAQFKKNMPAQEIANPSPQNPMLVSPFTKAMVAKDGVNQGAAIVLTSYKNACDWGVPSDKFIFLHGFAKTKERHLTVRSDPSRSPALELALNGAMCMAGVETLKVSHADLYSCFPIVVFNSKGVLNKATLKSLTQTGGLPFFGGPGNNYTLHGIAEMVETLRKNPADFGVVQGNGGFMSKHSVGIYGAVPPAEDIYNLENDFQKTLDGAPKVKIETQASGEGKLLSYCLSYQKGIPKNAIILAELSSGNHTLARYEGDLTALSNLKLGESLIFEATPKGNIAKLD